MVRVTAGVGATLLAWANSVDGLRRLNGVLPVLEPSRRDEPCHARVSCHVRV
jgi:hypothetical protein